MEKFPDHFLRSNVANISNRKDGSKGPHYIRIASNESEFFLREGKLILTMPMSGDLNNKRICDVGYLNR